VCEPGCNLNLCVNPDLCTCEHVSASEFGSSELWFEICELVWNLEPLGHWNVSKTCVSLKLLWNLKHINSLVHRKVHWIQTCSTDSFSFRWQCVFEPVNLSNWLWTCELVVKLVVNLSSYLWTSEPVKWLILTQTGCQLKLWTRCMFQSGFNLSTETVNYLSHVNWTCELKLKLWTCELKLKLGTQTREINLS
jgi:hypothetical protein